MRFGNLQLKACKYGWMLFTGPYIGKCFELYGEYSEAEVDAMRLFLCEGSYAIDVGANIGDLTVPMARLVGDTGRVIAIESHAEMHNVLCANLALNHLQNTKPMNVFVGSRSDVSTASTAWATNAYASEIWEPRIMPLDALDLPRCDFIKIDVDGKERDVLVSGSALIDRYRPVLYFENDQPEHSPALLAHAMALDYDLYWHVAPIFRPDNHANNPVNHWAPKNISSIMTLGIPSERNTQMSGLPRIRSKDESWLDHYSKQA